MVVATLARAAVAIVGGLVFTVCSAAAQQTSQCAGPINDPHPHGVFDFDTNARLEPTTQAFYKFAIIPCVKNNKANFLRIRWLIPDVFGWVPPNVTKYWVPRLVKDENVFQLKGCLEYGNRGDMTHAAFLGTGEDKPSVKREETQGCRATVVRYDLPKEGLIEKLQFLFREYFPTDSSKPDSTMLRVEGSVGVENVESDQYTSVVLYQAVRHEGSEGVIQEMTLRPSFKGAAEQLLSAYSQKNLKEIKLGEKGVIAFDVRNVKNPVLTYASYEFYDRKGDLVGALSFPVFVSRP